MKAVLISSAMLILHAYFGYPLSLCVWGLLRGRKRRNHRIEGTHPEVTLIIAVHNEAKRIKEKIENTLRLEYPRNKRRIIVASDGSTDQTNDLVNLYVPEGVELIALPERRGKESAQREAVMASTGEILVFTDVSTKLNPDALMQIVSNFADSTVGCVSSEDRLLDKGRKPSGEGLYVRYEMWLRRLESNVHSLVGLSGSFFAARRELCKDFSTDMQSDFKILLNSIEKGLRGITDPNSIGYYPNVAEEKRELERKVRTVLRGLTVFFRHVRLLNVFRYGVFSYQLFCHKMLRWLVPGFLVAFFLSSLALSADSALYLGIALCQVGFYGCAIAGRMTRKGPQMAVFRVPVYFLMVNLSILIAWWRYIRGQRIVMWSPSDR